MTRYEHMTLVSVNRHSYKQARNTFLPDFAGRRLVDPFQIAEPCWRTHAGYACDNCAITSGNVGEIADGLCNLCALSEGHGAN